MSDEQIVLTCYSKTQYERQGWAITHLVNMDSDKETKCGIDLTRHNYVRWHAPWEFVDWNKGEEQYTCERCKKSTK